MTVLHWTKSSYSFQQSECVEVADAWTQASRSYGNRAEGSLPDHLLRDSKNPSLGRLAFGPHEWQLFLGAIKRGVTG